MKQIVHTFEKNKITTDEILTHFFLKGMNECFKNQLISITNNSNPSLNEIMDNFFVANERYAVIQANFKKNKTDTVPERAPAKTSVAFKAEVSDSNPFNTCSLCSNNNNHPINKCIIYTTPESKVDRLEELKACRKCANLGHKAGQCKFRFRKSCNICDLWHFTFLCTSERREPRGNNRSSSNLAQIYETNSHEFNREEVSTSSVLSVSHSLRANSDFDIIFE